MSPSWKSSRCCSITQPPPPPQPGFSRFPILSLELNAESYPICWLCCSASGMMNTFQSCLSGSDFRDQSRGPGYQSYCISREIHHAQAFPQHMHTLITFTSRMQMMGMTRFYGLAVKQSLEYSASLRVQLRTTAALEMARRREQSNWVKMSARRWRPSQENAAACPAPADVTVHQHITHSCAGRDARRLVFHTGAAKSWLSVQHLYF